MNSHAMDADRSGFAAVFEHAPIGMAVVDLQGRIEHANRALCRMLGYARDGLDGMAVEVLIHAGDHEETLALHEALVSGEFDSYRMEKRCLRSNGSEVWVRVAVSLMQNEKGPANRSVHMIEDISDRKQFELFVERLSREYELILNTAGWGILGTDSSGVISFVNPSAARMLGWEVEELLSRPVLSVHHSMPDGTPYGDEGCAICRALRDGLSRSSDNDVLWRRDGTSLPVEYTITPVLGEDGAQGVVVAFMDITEKLRMQHDLQKRFDELKQLNQQLESVQHQLLQSEKMAAVGQLAAGVAHEINNPVGFVSSNLNTLGRYTQDMLEVLDAYAAAEADAPGECLAAVRRLRDEKDLGFLRDDLRELLAESKDGLERVKAIVLDLKDFSRVDAAEEWVWADLRHGLESTLNIVWNELKYKAEVVRQYGEISEIECLPSQLNQVFMNMLVNAGHAIETKGTITVHTGSEGDEVWVEIADTGRGIAQENMRRIFEPFFTTKAVGNGTGLGLSLSYGIVQKHGGRIEVQSEPGQGTAFRIWLPVQRREAEAG
jgi:PAS domain S-box-containing protein